MATRFFKRIGSYRVCVDGVAELQLNEKQAKELIDDVLTFMDYRAVSNVERGAHAVIPAESIEWLKEEES